MLMGSPEGWPALREVSLSFIGFMSSRDGKAIQELSMTKLAESERVQFKFDVMLLRP